MLTLNKISFEKMNKDNTKHALIPKPMFSSEDPEQL